MSDRVETAVQDMTALAALNNADRLEALGTYRILNSPPEQSYDDIVVLAAQLCETPTALVTLIDANRQWFKARVNFPPCETDLARSVCQYGLGRDTLLLIPDLTQDPRTRDNPLVSGEPFIRFYAGAPLTTPSGLALGMLCVIDTEPRPQGLTPEQADALYALARQIISQLELRKAIAERDTLASRQQQLDLRALQNRALELAIDDSPLPRALEELMRAVEERSTTDVLGSILLVDEDGARLRHGAAPSLPAAYNDAVDGITIGPGVGSCGTAAHTKAPVHVADVALDPLWSDFRELALSHGLKACWSTPILGSQGAVLGTFAMYHRAPREPAAADLEIVALITRAAALIVERKRAEAALQETAERYRLAALATSDAVWDWDLITNHVLWNEALEAAYGHAPGTVVPTGDWWIAHIHPDDAARVDASIHAVIDGAAASWTHEYRFQRADGSYADVLDRGHIIRDDSGRATRMVGAMLDLTERRRGEEERRRLVAVIDQSPDFIGIADTNGRGIYLNEGARRMCGLPAEVAIKDLAIIDFFCPEDREFVRQVVLPAQMSPKGYQGELRFRHFGGGAPVSVSYDGFTIRNADGEVTAFATVTRDITERKLAEAQLKEGEERLRLATEAAEVGFWDVDFERDELIWPSLTKGMFGISPEKTVSLTDFYEGLHPEDREAVTLAFAAACDPQQRALYDVEYRTVGKEDGIIRWIAAKGQSIFDDAGRCRRAVGTAIDVTTRKQIEAQLRELNETLEIRVAEEVAERGRAEEALRQSQKMEAVGQLTGGIAHDFNNMLAVVIGSLNLLERRIGTGDARAKRYVDAAIDGARRGASLTQRLLAFSRQQPLKPEPINANKLVGGMSDLLNHSLGSDVRLETILAAGLWRTHADPNQLENVILNLAINARDAMPEGGRLTIETANCHLDARYASAHLGVPEGQYVMIAVTDNGSGMPAEVVAKAFDPFFTTKTVGKGTGLGLSQVYGFIKQSGGHVKIYSEPGEGTTIKVYLPRLVGAEAESADIATVADIPRGEHQEVVLVVEDEPAVRQFSLDALTELGYRVLEADGAAAALRLLDAHPGIALMFTDVVMPDVNGAKLAEEARRRRPDLKVLFTTGYTRNAVVHNGVLDPGVELIGKPYSIEELAAKVREVLDRPIPKRTNLDSEQ